MTSPAMWEVHLHQERAFCDIENCCSYRDERWRVGKLIVSRTQTWHQKHSLYPDAARVWGGVTSQLGLSKTTGDVGSASTPGEIAL